MSLPSTMKAFKCTGPDQAAVQEVPLPKMRSDYLRVKIHAVALNPTDWKHIKGIPTAGATVGCDFAGTVVDIGDDVSKSFEKGDRVAGFTHGTNAVQPEDGSFGEYCMVKGDVAIKLPDNLSFEEGATLGVGVITVGQGMYQTLDMPRASQPTKDKTPILIYGGSTATGLFALQYARASGLHAITLCSPRNNDLVKSHGAAVVFDYSDPDVGSKIRAHTDNKLYKAFDCISEGSSAQICADALSEDGSKAQYSSLLPVKFPREDVKTGYTLGYTVTGERFTFRGGMEMPAKPQDFEFGKEHVTEAEGLLASGAVKPIRMDVRQGGLEKIQEGLDDLKNGRVSGKKIVYTIA